MQTEVFQYQTHKQGTKSTRVNNHRMRNFFESLRLFRVNSSYPGFNYDFYLFYFILFHSIKHANTILNQFKIQNALPIGSGRCQWRNKTLGPGAEHKIGYCPVIIVVICCFKTFKAIQT